MRVRLKRTQCIGCGNCTIVCPDYFEIGNDGLSHLKGSNKEGEEEVLEVAEEKAECVKEAAETCPVQIIKLE